MSQATPAELRKLFLLRDDVVFLNHGSFGACPAPVFAVYQELSRELEAQPVAFLDMQRSLPARLAAVRSRLAASFRSGVQYGRRHRRVVARSGGLHALTCRPFRLKARLG